MRLFLRMCVVVILLVGVVACGQQSSQSTPDAHMGHGMSTDAPSDAPYDLLFLDSMIVHHQGAIDMAKMPWRMPNMTSSSPLHKMSSCNKMAKSRR